MTIRIAHGFPAKLIGLIHATLDESKSSVRVADGISSSFVTYDGLKQGDAIKMRRAGVQRSGTILTRPHMLLGFADDTDIIGINRRAVEEAFQEGDYEDWTCD